MSYISKQLPENIRALGALLAVIAQSSHDGSVLINAIAFFQALFREPDINEAMEEVCRHFDGDVSTKLIASLHETAVQKALSGDEAGRDGFHTLSRAARESRDRDAGQGKSRDPLCQASIVAEAIVIAQALGIELPVTEPATLYDDFVQQVGALTPLD